MLKVCPYKCKESSDLNFRGKLKAIHSAYLIFNIVWYFQKKCDIDILTIFWKWHDNCITIYRQTIFWGLVETLFGRMPFEHAVFLCGASLSFQVHLFAIYANAGTVFAFQSCKLSSQGLYQQVVCFFRSNKSGSNRTQFFWIQTTNPDSFSSVLIT